MHVSNPVYYFDMSNKNTTPTPVSIRGQQTHDGMMSRRLFLLSTTMLFLSSVFLWTLIASIPMPTEARQLREAAPAVGRLRAVEQMQTDHSSSSTSSSSSRRSFLRMPAQTETATGSLSLLERLRMARWEKAGTGARAVQPLGNEPVSTLLNQRSVYLAPRNAGNIDNLNRVLDESIAVGANAIIFDVKGSRVYFDTTSPMAKELGLVVDSMNLDEVLAAAKAKGAYTMARFIAVKDDGLSNTRSDSLLVNPQTGRKMSPGWTDPANEVTLQYNREILCDLGKAGIDEVNLDYIRFSTAFFGELRVYSGDEKAERIEKFLRMAKETLHNCSGGHTKLGISTFAILGWSFKVNKETLGQDIIRFAPLVDVISPMAYPATFTSPEYYVPGKHPRSRMYWLVYRTLTGYKDLIGEDQFHKVRPWIQGYSITPADFKEQMDAVYDSGACGFTVWNASNNFTPVIKGMSTQKIPEKCL